MSSLSFPGAAGASARDRAVVVDDDDAVRAVLGCALRRFGFDVTAFAGGVEARAWLEENECRFVLTDLFMPDSDGVQLVRWLHQNRPVTGVAALSGDGFAARRLLRTAGVPDTLPVLLKPFSLDQLEILSRQLSEPAAGELAR